MARVTLPPSRLRARRRRRRMVVGALLLGALAVLGVALVGLMHAPFLEIESVQVTGAHTVPTSTVEARVQGELAGNYAWVLPRDNIFIYPNKRITAALSSQYPVFKSVEVHAVDFRTIAVTVAEREPVALWCPQDGGDGCMFMDEDGTSYASAPHGSDAVFVTYQGTSTARALPMQFLTPEGFRSLTALIGALSATEPGNPVRQVAVDGSKDVRAFFQNGFVLIFALGDAGGDVFERFTLALKADPFMGRKLGDFEYLDLRWGDKLYYKLK